MSKSPSAEQVKLPADLLLVHSGVVTCPSAFGSCGARQLDHKLGWEAVIPSKSRI